MKIWDILKGGQQLVSLKNHHKTVTCACLSSNDNRLLTGSLDRYAYRILSEPGFDFSFVDLHFGYIDDRKQLLNASLINTQGYIETRSLGQFVFLIQL